MARTTKPVQLAVHKNTVEGRRKRALATELRSKAERLTRERDIRAFAIVGIAADGQAYAFWDTGAVLPLWAFADTVANVLRTDIQNAGIEDDWRPALTLKGGK